MNKPSAIGLESAMRATSANRPQLPFTTSASRRRLDLSFALKLAVTSARLAASAALASSKSAAMLLIVGTVRLPAERLEDARPVMARMISASRSEDGCEEYAYAEDVLEPGLIHVKELWRDQAALDRHFASAHIAAWRAAWPTLGIADRNLRVFEVGEPRST